MGSPSGNLRAVRSVLPLLQCTAPRYISPIFHNSSRHSDCYGIVWYASDHNRPGPDNAAFPYVGTVQKGDLGSNPAAVLDYNALAIHALILYGAIEVLIVVVFRMEAYVLSHYHLVTDPNSAGGANRRKSADR